MSDAPRYPLSRVARAAYASVVLCAGLIFWIAPYPGMQDLPQHAAQVGLLHDLMMGTSPWSDLVRIHWFTPYLVGYGLALPLSFVMPVTAAMKLILTAAYYAFVLACVALRREFHGDPRLDWLFLPGFFGFSFQFGFYTFLVAAPLGLVFVLAARRFAARPTVAGGAGILAAGGALFFCHGLVFLFACAIGVGFILVHREHRERPRIALACLAPYALLGVLALVYFVAVKLGDPPLRTEVLRPAFEWDWFEKGGWKRSYFFFLQVFATWRSDGLFFLGGLFMLAAPRLLKLRANRADRMAWVPLAVLLVNWLIGPRYAMRTDFVYERFALFLLPAYALLFRAGGGEPDEATAPQVRSAWVEGALAVICCAFFGVVGIRQHRFAAETESFDTVLAAAEPEQRALGLIFSTDSFTIRNSYTYCDFAAWYEVEKRGFVDFNFAYFLPQIVRFKPGRTPPIPPRYNPDAFDWQALQARSYRYFFVRHVKPLPAKLFDNPECRVELLKEDRDWALFERKECRDL